MSDGYEDRLERIERRLDEIEKALKTLRGESAEKKKPAEEPSIVGGIVSQFIPGLGGIIKALEASSPEFKRRIAETDAEVRHRIEVGWSSKPVVDYGISIRPLSKPGARRPARPPEVRIPGAPRKEPIVDVMDDGESITVVAELPGVEEDELSVALREGVLDIRAGEFMKLVRLPPDAGDICGRSFKNGILQVRINRVRG
ncbi:MAG: Hsp20/alpha crystallin family protein [Methanothrix sp.]|jgi:HSP20 family molecular chaperone IbpA|uniref:Hsp20/alpha crystallin family protein n=1 Tax=Methanothrix sp. TaxID=90426 RepID=UPI00247CCEB9|nr:Hsp20/alpha crystallin family protein [Methanothrix sp.]